MVPCRTLTSLQEERVMDKMDLYMMDKKRIQSFHCKVSGASYIGLLLDLISDSPVCAEEQVLLRYLCSKSSEVWCLFSFLL